MKSGSIAIIGRPSSGKSTLVNTICEGKVSITASTPQTTRNAIKGIFTDQRGQLIFTDTPGYHIGEKAFNKRLQETAVTSLSDVDAILYVVDASRVPGAEEVAIIDIIRKTRKPIVVAINKKDLVSGNQIDTCKTIIASYLNDVPIFIISAKDDTGIDEVLIELFKIVPEGSLMYSEETFTDQPLEFRISEIIREKAISLVTEEIPHAIFVEVSDLEYSEIEQSVWIRAFINVERETQKGILIGKGGEGIKKIRQRAFKDIKKIFPSLQLHIDLRVKVQPKWRQNETLLGRILS
ncbi:MAG: GTPase Era [Sphaerochaetaceae bacterium]|jgi:GTP-binding protein Era|nr:GTPase Era [Sphaerochaetaceae bacterium]NLO60126.1 GTPase Era [Spirochaetales bacterium]MDD2406095.1 GTPase Era [Sphaerochaetaceae bacterium]MDD3670077.1 GTPase Era [Sphaerochaetaceae bacterium]MDD4260245.1 GTPase Era [Sphaerochaetaceae bacterium]